MSVRRSTPIWIGSLILSSGVGTLLLLGVTVVVTGARSWQQRGVAADDEKARLVGAFRPVRLRRTDLAEVCEDARISAYRRGSVQVRVYAFMRSSVEPAGSGSSLHRITGSVKRSRD